MLSRLLLEIDIRRPFWAHLSAEQDTGIRRAYISVTHIRDFTLSEQGRTPIETKTITYLLTYLFTYIFIHLLTY